MVDDVTTLPVMFVTIYGMNELSFQLTFFINHISP